MCSEKDFSEMLNPTIEEESPEYNSISVTISEESSPFNSRERFTYIEED